MDRRITEGIVLLSVILGAVAGPFFPLNVPVSDNFGYLNLGEISARTQFQYPLVQTIPQDFLQVKSPLLAAPRSEVCLSERCIINAADLLKQMDRNVDPCQDFFKFACGGFIADTVLPEHKTRTGFFVLHLLFKLSTFPFLGSFNVLGDQLNERLKKVFEAEPAAAEPSIYQGRVHLQ